MLQAIFWSIWQVMRRSRSYGVLIKDWLDWAAVIAVSYPSTFEREELIGNRFCYCCRINDLSMWKSPVRLNMLLWWGEELLKTWSSFYMLPLIGGWWRVVEKLKFILQAATNLGEMRFLLTMVLPKYIFDWNLCYFLWNGGSVSSDMGVNVRHLDLLLVCAHFELFAGE